MYLSFGIHASIYQLVEAGIASQILVTWTMWLGRELSCLLKLSTGSQFFPSGKYCLSRCFYNISIDQGSAA